MPRFFYKALTSDGSTVTGDMVAENDLLVLEQISRRGLVPLSVSRSGAGSSLRWWQRDISFGGTSGHLSLAIQEQMLATLSALLEARLPLMRAIAFCSENAGNAQSIRAFSAIRDEVENGSTLADAMAAVSPGFLPDLLAVIRSGEVSNQLPTVLRRASNALATQARIRREIRSALVYPGFLLGLSIAILLMIALYLAPTLLPVFVSSNVPPPAVLSALDGLGQGLKSGWPVLLVLIGLGTIVFWAAKQRLGVAWQRIAWRIPLLGAHLKRQETLKMASAIGLMLDSGATLMRAVATAREATDHPYVVAMLERAEQAITGGQTLSPVLEKAGLIDPMSMTLIMAGEEADSLPEAFEMVSRLLEARISQGITQAVKLITPILTLGLGLGVGSIILATVSAIMDMNDLAI